MQIFPKSSNAIARASLFAVVVVVASVFWMLNEFQRSPYITWAGVRKSQPVPFSHQHHVAAVGIDCRYCHTSVETSSFAGIPPTKKESRPESKTRQTQWGLTGSHHIRS